MTENYTKAKEEYDTAVNMLIGAVNTWRHNVLQYSTRPEPVPMHVMEAMYRYSLNVDRAGYLLSREQPAQG